MTWTFYPAKSGFAELAAAWDDLNRRLYREHPMLDSAFVGPLVQYFASSDDRLAVCRTTAGVEAMLLLVSGRPGIWPTFLPSQAQIAPMLLADPAHLDDLLRALPKRVVALDLLCQDAEYSALPSLPPCSAHEVTLHATTTATSLVGSFDAYWQSRPQKLRENLRRSFKRVEQAGLKFRLEVASSPALVREACARYGLLESRGWKGKAGTAINPDNAQGHFYQEMLALFAARGQAFACELYLDDALAASELLIGNEFMVIGLKTTYDETITTYSPGRLLHYLVLQRLFLEQRHRGLEYYTNATPDTLRWGTSQRAITHHRFYRYSWLPPLMRGYRGLKAAVARLRARRAGGMTAAEPPSRTDDQ
jgi:CelD/BcsL family acetyltransferase involved in cellulose biosynthesis